MAAHASGPRLETTKEEGRPFSTTGTEFDDEERADASLLFLLLLLGLDQYHVGQHALVCPFFDALKAV